MGPHRAASVVSALFLVGLLTGAATGVNAVARAREAYTSLETLVRVLATIEASYVDEVPREVLVDAAIRGMVAELDPHSRWLSDQEAAQLTGDVTRPGIGVDLEVGLRVSRVEDGSPAARDGLAVGDRLLTIDGEPVTGLAPEDVLDRLRGPRGDFTVLGVLRAGSDTPVEIRTRRDQVEPPLADAALFGGVLYLHLTQFDSGATDELAAFIQDNLPIDGIVLDLRDNPGGLLDEAIAVADLFLESGPIAATVGRLPGENAVFEATPGGVATSLPMAVLVNAWSASAAEIVAGALQDTGRAPLVGSRTYGKGSVQTLFPTHESGTLKLTVARYLTPSGSPVADHQGREPDHAVAMPHAVPSQLGDLRAEIHRSVGDEAARTRLLAQLDFIERSTVATGAEAPPSGIDWSLEPGIRLRGDPQFAAALAIVTGRRR